MSFDLKLVNGDLSIKNGDVAIVQNGDKLVQDILKMVGTKRGSNPSFPYIGSEITSALIGTANSYKFISDIASEQLKSSLELLQKLQKDQLKQNQVVTPHEQLAMIKDLIVQQSSSEPRGYSISFTAISKAFAQQNIDFTISP
jgi:hypothetical protein